MNSIYSSCWYGSGSERILTINCLPILFKEIILWLLIFSGVVALFIIIWGGIRFITSGGDQKQVEEARKVLTYAVIGLVLILLSFAIVRFIADLTDTKCIKDFGFECNTGSSSGRF